MKKKKTINPDRISIAFGLTLQMGEYEPMKVDTFKATDKKEGESDEEVVARLTNDVLNQTEYVIKEGAKRIQAMKDLAFEQLSEEE